MSLTPFSPTRQAPHADDPEFQSWVATIQLSEFYEPGRSVSGVARFILTCRSGDSWTPIERVAYQLLDAVDKLPEGTAAPPPSPGGSAAVDDDDELDDDDDASSAKSGGDSESSQTSVGDSESSSGKAESSSGESIVDLTNDVEPLPKKAKLGALAFLQPMSSQDIKDAAKNLKSKRSGKLEAPKKPEPPADPPKRRRGMDQETDEEEDAGGDGKKKKKKKKPREYKFNDDWRKKRPWLTYGEGKMFCSWCQRANANTVWAKDGCTSLRAERVQEHENGPIHQKVASDRIKEADQRKQDSGLLPVAREPENPRSSTSPYFSLFANAHLCAVKNFSNLSFPAMCQHDRLKGVPLLDRFQNNVQCTEFEVCISEILKGDLQKKLLKSPVVAITIDESTDVAHLSQMMIYVKYIDVDAGWIVKTEYLETLECDGADSKSIFDTLKACLQRWKIYEKMVAFGSDGATVMIGEHSGVATRLAFERKGMISIHCIAHRGALAAADAFGKVAFCKTLDECLRAVSNFYSLSTERRKELKGLCALNNDPETQVGSAAKTRWLTTGLVTDSVMTKYDSIMEQHYNNTGVTVTSEAILINSPTTASSPASPIPATSSSA